MTTPARVAAAAIIGVLAIGGGLFIARPGPAGVGGPGPTPSAAPTSTATPSASASPAGDTRAGNDHDVHIRSARL